MAVHQGSAGFFVLPMRIWAAYFAVNVSGRGVKNKLRARQRTSPAAEELIDTFVRHTDNILVPISSLPKPCKVNNFN